MKWWEIVFIVVWVALGIVDWIVIMGTDPRQWKGGGYHGKHQRKGRR